MGMSSNTELFTEYAEQNERELCQQLSKLIDDRMDELYENDNPARRDTHTKSHAAVQAKLEIFDFNDNDIKEKLIQTTALTPEQVEPITIKQGLFAQPKQYPVWLRFANGRGSVNEDRKSDTRSMSVKIIGVDGERLDDSHESTTHDIITQNAEMFFVKTIRHYNSFLSKRFTSNLKLALWLAFHPYQAWALIKIKKHAPQSLLTEHYWSGSAYALGLPSDTSQWCPDASSVRYPAVLKYAFIPVRADNSDQVIDRQPLSADRNTLSCNYYREELINSLDKPDAKYCWDLRIQFQATPKMSIDDVVIRWKEQDSPYFRVGRLTVEQQQIDFAEQSDFVENLGYSPWNGLAIHRPVGALNRLRRIVYPIVRKYRHQKNGVEYEEPTIP